MVVLFILNPNPYSQFCGNKKSKVSFGIQIFLCKKILKFFFFYQIHTSFIKVSAQGLYFYISQTMDADSTTRFVPEHRRTNFKNRGAFKADELRRRREEAQVEIRKQKRDQNLTKRRNITNLNNFSDSEDDDDEDERNEKRRMEQEVCFLFIIYRTWH